MHTYMILIHLKKALDTLDPKILLKKMTRIGFITAVINWFESYLSSRNFYVSVQDMFSKVWILDCGVPQGFILGPFLIFYVNKLTIFSNHYQKVALTFRRRQLNFLYNKIILSTLDLVTFTKENLNVKLHFLCSVLSHPASHINSPLGTLHSNLSEESKWEFWKR